MRILNIKMLINTALRTQASQGERCKTTLSGVPVEERVRCTDACQVASSHTLAVRVSCPRSASMGLSPVVCPCDIDYLGEIPNWTGTGTPGTGYNTIRHWKLLKLLWWSQRHIILSIYSIVLRIRIVFIKQGIYFGGQVHTVKIINKIKCRKCKTKYWQSYTISYKIR